MKQLFTQFVLVGIILLFALPLTAQRKKTGFYSEVLSNGKFIPYDTGTYEYNGLNKLIAEERSYYNNADRSWIPYWQVEYTYNSNSDIDYYESASHDGTKWNKSHHYSHLYDTNKNLITIFDLRNSQGNWVNYSKQEYRYNSQNQNDTITLFYIDSAGNFLYSKWDLKTIYTYNANGKIDFELNLYRNKISQQWDSSFRSFYIYDANGLQQKLISESYDPNVGWVKIEHYTYTYDSEGLLRYWEKYSYNDKKITNRGYLIYEFDGPLSIKKPTQIEVTLFPNPASQNATFSWHNAGNMNLEIHDALGRIVFLKQEIKTDSYTLTTETLSNGLYTCTLYNDDKTIINSSRLVISK